MATSIVGALIDLYESIAADKFGGTDRPRIDLGEAPATGAAGAQLRPPYAVLFDEGFKPQFDSSAGGVETGRVRMELFAFALKDVAGVVTVEAFAAAVKWGGVAPAAKAGFDWGSFTLTGYNYRISLVRTLQRIGYAGFDYQEQRVHKCELRWDATLGLKST